MYPKQGSLAVKLHEPSIRKQGTSIRKQAKDMYTFFSRIVSPACATWHARLSECRQNSLSKEGRGQKVEHREASGGFLLSYHIHLIFHYCISGERRSIGSYERDCMVSPLFSLYYFFYELGKAVFAKLPVYSVHECSGVIEFWRPRDFIGKLGPLMFSVLLVLSLIQNKTLGKAMVVCFF